MERHALISVICPHGKSTGLSTNKNQPESTPSSQFWSTAARQSFELNSFAMASARWSSFVPTRCSFRGTHYSLPRSRSLCLPEIQIRREKKT